MTSERLRFVPPKQPRGRNLVAFTGLKQSGKDTAATSLTHRGYAHVKMAEPMKQMLRVLLQYRGAPAGQINRMLEGDLKEVPTPYLNGRTPRYAMQTLGTEWGRELMAEDFWIGAARDRIEQSPRVVVSDIRFGNEADLIRELGGTLYRIEREGQTVTDLHPSEVEITTMPVDATIVNDAPSGEVFTERVGRLVR